jgi:hypothetical protein
MIIFRTEVHDFFGYGEDAGLAGDGEEAVMRVATEPARPAKAAIVKRTIETVTRERF